VKCLHIPTDSTDHSCPEIGLKRGMQNKDVMKQASSSVRVTLMWKVGKTSASREMNVAWIVTG
jgi:hypothetical protein